MTKNRLDRREFLATMAGIAYLASPLSTLASTPKGPEYDFRKDSEKTLLAKMLYGEARGLFEEEDQREAIMIGLTAVNRANDKMEWNGKTLKEALLKYVPRKTRSGKTIYVHQYSCFNDWDPNATKLKNPEKHDKEAWEQALHLAENILENKLTHLNYGQSHYVLKDTEEQPNWANDPRYKKVWGQPYFKHNFYKDLKA